MLPRFDTATEKGFGVRTYRNMHFIVLGTVRVPLGMVPLFSGTDVFAAPVPNLLAVPCPKRNSVNGV